MIIKEGHSISACSLINLSFKNQKVELRYLIFTIFRKDSRLVKINESFLIASFPQVDIGSLKINLWFGIDVQIWNVGWVYWFC